MARRTMSRRVLSASAWNIRSKSRVVGIDTTVGLYRDGCQVRSSGEVLAEPVEHLGVGLGGRGLVVAGAGVVEEGVAGTRVGDDLMGQGGPLQGGRGRVPGGVHAVVLLGVDAEHGRVGEPEKSAPSG